MIPVEDLFKSKSHWHRGVLALMKPLYAIVDFCLMERDQYIQTWLYNHGYLWAGDPKAPDAFVGIPYHRILLQDHQYEMKALKNLDADPNRLAMFLEQRDRVIRGTQELFSDKPDVLYLLCLHLELRLEESATAQELDINDPPHKGSMFTLYPKSKLIRETLSTIYPDLRKSEDDWMVEYKKHF